MAKSQALESFNSLPSWSKGVLAIGVVVIAYVIYNRTRNAIKGQQEAKSATGSVAAGEADLKNLQDKGTFPTITGAQASSFAEAMVKQFKGADLLLQSYGVVERAFNALKNNADYLMLRKAFGVRTYDDALWG
ncbi:MAG: hypothetical protein RLY43_935, partial [Bacteroidota bacterium]